MENQSSNSSPKIELNESPVRIIPLEQYKDIDGTLIPFEFDNEIPFQPTRVFFIKDVPENATRANHACMNAQFIYHVLKGNVNVHIDLGNVVKDIVLSSRNPELLLIPKASWVSLNSFTPGTIVMVLSDLTYSQSRYVDNYNLFLKLLVK